MGTTDEHGCVSGALEGHCPTLHIRCGSDIRDGLREAGFIDDFLEWSDPICQGPMPDAPDLLQRRARFLEHVFDSVMEHNAVPALA